MSLLPSLGWRIDLVLVAVFLSPSHTSRDTLRVYSTVRCCDLLVGRVLRIYCQVVLFCTVQLRGGSKVGSMDNESLREPISQFYPYFLSSFSPRPRMPSATFSPAPSPSTFPPSSSTNQSKHSFPRFGLSLFPHCSTQPYTTAL